MIQRLVLCVSLLVCSSAGNAPALSGQVEHLFTAPPHAVLFAEARARQPSNPEEQTMPVREVHPERNLLPSPQTAATMLDRLVDLWEKGCLQSFTVLDDAILDAVVSETFFYGDSPVAGHVLTPQNRPDIFGEATAGVGGTAPDMALHRRDAAEIARFYLGRPAGLAGLKEIYLFGNMADGPHMCHARTTGITAHTAGGAFVTGNIVCMDDPETKARIQRGALRVQLVQDTHAPLGWTVQSVEINKSCPADDAAVTVIEAVWARELPAGTKYESCVVDTEPQATIALRATRPVFEVALLGLEYEGVDDTGKTSFKTRVLHSYAELKPDHPLVIALTFYGTIPGYGIAYRDADGTVRRFAIQESGMDGSLELLEF